MSADDEGAATTRHVLCVRCLMTRADGVCCSSHDRRLCHRCYRLTHFVEVCGCAACDRENLPRIYPERPVAAPVEDGETQQ